MIFIKILFIVLLSLGLSSCSGYLEETSEVKPIAKAKSISEALGVDKDNKFLTKTIYIPLNASSISHYDHDLVIGRDHLINDSNLTNIIEGLKVGFLNLGMNLASKNKVKISSEFDFSFIDTSFVKGVKIKNVFFNIKKCDERNETCQSRIQEKSLSLSIIKEMFINFTPLEHSVINDEVQINTSLRKYNSISNQAFRTFLDSESINGKSLYNDFTIANYKYSQSKRNKDIERVIILKTEGDYSWDVKNLLSSSKYSRQVEIVSLIGNNVYIKLRNSIFRETFLSKLKKEKLFTDKRITSILNCTSKQCMNFNVNQSNLIPLIEKSPLIKIDTFLNLNRLTKTDFEYQGLLEIEIKIDMSNN